MGWKMPEMTEMKYDRKQKQLSFVKHYERMRELGCFSLRDITDMVGEQSAVKYLVNDYQRKGYIDSNGHRDRATDADTVPDWQQAVFGCVHLPAQCVRGMGVRAADRQGGLRCDRDALHRFSV